jgi:hypothetical protein
MGVTPAKSSILRILARRRSLGEATGTTCSGRSRCRAAPGKSGSPKWIAASSPAGQPWNQPAGTECRQHTEAQHAAATFERNRFFS